MENEKQQIIVAENLVAGKVYYLRDRRVILDRDLAEKLIRRKLSVEVKQS